MRKSSGTRILVVDNQYCFLQGVISILNEESEFIVVGEAKNWEEAINMSIKLSPDIVILNICMPMKSGIEIVRKLIKMRKNIKTLFFSAHSTPELEKLVHYIGGCGLIERSIEKNELVSIIKEVDKGKTFINNRHLKEEVANEEYIIPAILDCTELTRREKDVLAMIGEGYTSDGISSKLFLSKRTIDSHRRHIIMKLQLKYPSDLLRIAINYNKLSNN